MNNIYRTDTRMSWKFWKWPKLVQEFKEAAGRDFHNLTVSANDAVKGWNDTIRRERAAERNLILARRALARGRERGMDDEEMAEAFTHLLENKGFEAILQLLTDAELNAVDRMTEDGANFAAMKKAAGAVEALTHFHHRLVELEAEAKAKAKKAA